MRNKDNDLKIVLILLIILSFVYVLISSNLDIYFYVTYYKLILNINYSLQIILLAIIIYFVVQLLRQVRKNIFGAVITRKLFLILLLIATIPAGLNIVISQYFIKNTVNSWFNPQMSQVLDNAFSLADRTLKYFGEELQKKSFVAMDYLSNANKKESLSDISRLKNLLSLDDLWIYKINGDIYLRGKSDKYFVSSLSEQTLEKIRTDGFFYEVQHQPSSTTHIFRFYLLYRSNSQDKILAIAQQAPEFMQLSTHKLNVSEKLYLFLSENRQKLKDIYSDTLLTIILLSISIAIMSSVYFSKYLIRPLNSILEGTKLIGQGVLNKNNLPNTNNHDELSMLVIAFKQMSKNLDKMRKIELAQKNQITEYKDYLENILNNLSSGIVVFDDNLQVKSINKISESILNIELEKLNNVTIDNWVMVYPYLTELVSLILSSNNTNDLEFNYKFKPNTKMHKNLFVKIIRFGVDENLNMILVSDITNLMTSKQNEVWSEIAKRLAHEIKNPLTPIVLSAERIEMKLMPKLNDTDKQFLDKLIKQIILQVEELKKLVNKFRDFASINKPQLVKVNLNTLLAQILTLYEEYNYIKLSNTNENGDIIVLGDESLLRQVLHNLLKNSIDAVESVAKKEVIVTLSKDELYGYIHIKDNGTGFGQEILDNIFEPYRTTKGEKGSGLGLAIVKKIIDEHNGKLDIYNDNGAQIIVQIPLFKHNLLREWNHA